MSGCYSGKVTVISTDFTPVLTQVRLQDEELVVREVFTSNLKLSWHMLQMNVRLNVETDASCLYSWLAFVVTAGARTIPGL